MEGFDPTSSFGYDVSKRYDAGATRGDEEQTVAFLDQLALGRDALEFAVGTGRIALPLTAAGVRVDGIEVSQHMVDRMREKRGGSGSPLASGMWMVRPVKARVHTSPSTGNTPPVRAGSRGAAAMPC